MRATVYAMADATPSGAAYITRLVKRNMTSLRLSVRRSTGAALAGGVSARAMPKMAANTATCRTCPFRDGLCEVFWKNVRQKILPVHGRRSRYGSGEIDGHLQPHTSLGQVRRDQPDNQRNRGQNLKVKEALPTHAPDTLQITMPGNAAYQRGKDQRSNDGFYQTQKDVAEEMCLHREGRRIQSKLHPCDHGHHDPGCQAAS